MAIRITQGTLYSRALFDMQRGLFRYSQLQTEVATGRRVNRPSDDPAAALRILPLRGDIRDLEQLSNNVSLARETLNTSTASLEDGSSIMQRVRELATQAANGTLSNSDRQSVAAEVDQLLDQMLGIANSRRGDRYLFGGTETGSQPFRLETVGGRTRAVYSGNRDSLEVDVAPGVTTGLNVPGDSIFLSRDRTATTFSPAFGENETGIASFGSGDTGIGFAQLDITFAGLHTDAPAEITAGSGNTTALGQLNYVFTTGPDTLSIEGGPALPVPVTDGQFRTADGREIALTVTGVPATTTGSFTSKANLSTDGGLTQREVDLFGTGPAPVRNSENGSMLYLDPSNLVQTGVVDVKYGGTFDVFTTLAELRDILVNDGDISDAGVRDRIGDLLGEVDSAHDAVLDGLRELGFRSSSMDVLQNRVEGLRVSRAESLSLVEDTDIAESILELQRQDLSYQTALQVSARVLQTSLQGFLR
ncbi:MAG: flagellar hook-associated protein FlgL [Planctomycetota bacterium]